MRNILFITSAQNYFSITVREQMKNGDYEIISCEANVNKISTIEAHINTIVVFLDKSMLENPQALIFIKDRAVDEDTPIFIVGESEEIEIAKQYLPKDRIVKAFARPIDVKEIVSTVDTYVTSLDTELKKKILVVDDSGAMLRNVKGWLGDRYQVTPVNSGAMAIKYLSLNRPDLILLDYEMPVCDGKQVLEMIRSETDFTDIPVIFLTNKNDTESVMNVMKLRPDGYLLKTMPPELIIKAVDDFFQKRKSGM